MPPATILGGPNPPKPFNLHRKTSISAKASETSPAALWRPRRANPRLLGPLLPCPLGSLGRPGALLRRCLGALGACWNASEVAGAPPGRGRQAPGCPTTAQIAFSLAPEPSWTLPGAIPRTFFCQKCVTCLKPCPQPDATCACRRHKARQSNCHRSVSTAETMQCKTTFVVFQIG